MSAAVPHVLLLGCPHLGTGALARQLAALPGWRLLGDLRLMDAADAAELRDMLAHSQDRIPPDLLRALDAHYPGTRPSDGARLDAFLALRAPWTTVQLVQDLLARLEKKRAVLLETEGCLRVQTLERWLDVAMPLRFVHIVESPAEFVEAATAAIGDRLFVAPDYRSHTSNYPQFAPELAWWRIHRNIEIFLAAVPPDQQIRVPRAELNAAAVQGAESLLRVLQGGGGAPQPRLRRDRSALHPDLRVLTERYDV